MSSATCSPHHGKPVGTYGKYGNLFWVYDEVVFALCGNHGSTGLAQSGGGKTLRPHRLRDF